MTNSQRTAYFKIEHPGTTSLDRHTVVPLTPQWRNHFRYAIASGPVVIAASGNENPMLEAGGAADISVLADDQRYVPTPDIMIPAKGDVHELLIAFDIAIL